MNISRLLKLSPALIAMSFLAVILLQITSVSALSSSSLQLSDSRPSQASSYTFTTSGLSTGTTINCIQLDLGTAVDGTGDTGVAVTGATLGTNTIPSGGTWAVSVVDGTTDQLRATSAGGSTPNANGAITWNAVTNSSTTDTTFYGVFETFTNVDCSTGGPVDSAVVTFIFKDGALVSLTIDPTLSFTIAGVTSGGTINGVSTTITTTPTAVSFLNAVNSTTNGVSAHDLTVGTNASGGYSVYIRHTQSLTSGADTITDWTGTNAAPTSPFPTGSEAWGYTSNDGALLTGTANRFTNGGDNWSGFSTSTNELVGDGTGPVASATTRVGHQVAVDASTEAGTYQTTIIYTAASTY
jgi:hypothetical protein